KDEGKPVADERFGDAVLWLQTIAYAKEKNVPVILVTDERKEDWWHEAHGETLGPRPEMLQEFRKETGQPCYIYAPETFLERAMSHFQVAAEAPERAKVIEEAGKVRAAADTPSILDKLLAPSDLAQGPAITPEMVRRLRKLWGLATAKAAEREGIEQI